MSAPKPTPKPESRSHLAAIAWHLQGIVTGLRLAVSCGREPGPLTLQLIAAVRKWITSVEDGLGLTGPAIDVIPDLGENPNPVDVLVAAEALNAVIQCLLEPDERERMGMGFRPLSES